MKRENNFYYIFVMISFVVCVLTSYALTCRTVEVRSLVASASVIVYPATYFLATLYTERYGKDKLFNLLMFTIFSLVFSAGLISLTSLLPIYNGNETLNTIFDVNYRTIFSFMIAFLLSQFINIKIYYYLEEKKELSFFVSSIISVTVNSIVFVLLAYTGTVSFSRLKDMVLGEYVISVFTTLFYGLCFAYLIRSVLTSRKRNEDLEKEILERQNVKTTAKKSTAKKTESKKNVASNKTKKSTKKEA